MNKLKAMREGGAILGEIRALLYDFAQVGVSPAAIEALTLKLIKERGVEPSFTRVPKYHWATCINLNDGIVHGIPTGSIGLKDGDVVTVDLGVYHLGFHTDCAFTKIVGTSTPAKNAFIAGGLASLKAALAVIKPGNRVGHIGQAVEKTLNQSGFSPARELTGHGVGRELHEDPMIPNYLSGKLDSTPQLVIGQTLAIETIYVEGKPALIIDRDGWTISTKDGKLSGVFEETVEVTSDGCSILTTPSLFQIT